MKWRDNLIKTITEVLGVKFYPYGIPQVIIDSIDAAYLQGLEEKQKEKRRDVKFEMKEFRAIDYSKIYDLIIFEDIKAGEKLRFDPACNSLERIE